MRPKQVYQGLTGDGWWWWWWWCVWIWGGDLCCIC